MIMEWTEVSVSVPVEFIDTAGNIAQMVVPYGIYVEDTPCWKMKYRKSPILI